MGTNLRRYSVVFPAIAMVVTVACTSASGADAPAPAAKKSTTTTVKKATRSTTTTKPLVKGTGGDVALSVLMTIPVANENGNGYSRSLFRHWIDADGDSCDTREEVLIAESLSQAQVDGYGCKVVEGDWLSPYDNVRHTYPGELDIDHMVPLKEAWDSGAFGWTSARREAYANDMSDARSLIAVTNSVNRSKGDKDPSNWIPSNQAFVCTYLANWVAIKKHWGLSMDRSEWGRIKNLLTAGCAGTTIAAWGKGPQTYAATKGTTSAPAGTVSTTPSGGGSGSGSASTGGDIHPGSYCAPVGARGTYNGGSYVCSTTNASGTPYSGGRARWRQG